jgi:hypothetical protein
MSWTEKNAVWIFVIGFIATLMYIGGVVQPPLIFQHQQPVFFVGADYFAKLMQYPGGFVDYLSNLLGQFYNNPILGTFILSLVIWGVVLSAFRIFKLFNLAIVAPFLALLLGAFLLAAHGDYFYKLAYSLSILLSLLLFLFYHNVKKNHFIIRLVLFSIFARTLYVFVAAPFLIFIFLGLLVELFIQQENRVKKIIAGIVFSSSIFWPLIVHKYMFLYNSKDMYTYHLPIGIESSYRLWSQLVWALLVFSPLVGILISRIRPKNQSERKPRRVVEIVVLGLTMIILAVFVTTTFNSRHKIVLKIQRYAQQQQWAKVLNTAEENRDVLHRLITFHYNRALYHSGHLLDDLFAYPQIEGENGLIRNSGPSFDFPYAVAILMFDLGNINSAQTWANEALSIEGESARILKLLALIHLEKNELNAAELYINKVAKTIGNQKWVEHYKKLLTESHLIPNDPAFANRALNSVGDNFLIRFGNTYGELKMFYEAGTPSKMAFEYLMAYNLLSRRLDRVAALAPHFLNLPYTNLPQHLEEALILIGMSGVNYDVNLNAFDFSPDKVNGLRQFMSIIEKHNNNPQYAQGELVKLFGDTYWYYHIYHQGQELR